MNILSHLVSSASKWKYNVQRQHLLFSALSKFKLAASRAFSTTYFIYFGGHLDFCYEGAACEQAKIEKLLVMFMVRNSAGANTKRKFIANVLSIDPSPDIL